MLLANYYVAQQLVALFGPGAFLRRHARPNLGKMNALRQFCKSIGLKIDVSTAELLQESLKIALTDAHPDFVVAINSLLIQGMEVIFTNLSQRLSHDLSSLPSIFAQSMATGFIMDFRFHITLTSPLRFGDMLMWLCIDCLTWD